MIDFRLMLLKFLGKYRVGETKQPLNEWTSLNYDMPKADPAYFYIISGGDDISLLRYVDGKWNIGSFEKKEMYESYYFMKIEKKQFETFLVLNGNKKLFIKDEQLPGESISISMEDDFVDI